MTKYRCERRTIVLAPESVHGFGANAYQAGPSMAKRKDDDEVDVEEEAFEEEAPRPRTGVTGLTLLLCFLNIVAALGFVFLLSMDFGKRQAWSLAIFKHDLDI